jgi:hypothetical protein
MNPLNTKPGIWDYLFELRQKGIYKPKQRRVLTQIVIYTNELKVYKVAVFADERKKNKWNKYKVKELYKTYTPEENDKNISFPLLKHELIGSETGNKMFIYNFDKDEIKCFAGEEKPSGFKHEGI